MGNTLKMEKQEIINQLIEKGWSNRKINKATEIDRRTISKYRRIRSEREKQESDSDSDKQEQTYVNQEVCNSSQNAPLLGTNKCPPTHQMHPVSHPKVRLRSMTNRFERS